jgi:hypothetical protein
MGYAANMMAGTAQQFQNAANYTAFVNAFGAQLDDILEATIQVLTELFIPNAVGAQLDALGVELGLPRASLSDADYMAALQMMIRAYQSEGSIEDLIQIMLGFGGASSVQVVQQAHANANITITGIDATPLYSDQQTASILRRSAVAGVGVQVQIGSHLPTFQFDKPVSGNNAGLDQGHALGSF